MTLELIVEVYSQDFQNILIMIYDERWDSGFVVMESINDKNHSEEFSVTYFASGDMRILSIEKSTQNRMIHIFESV